MTATALQLEPVPRYALVRRYDEFVMSEHTELGDAIHAYQEAFQRHPEEYLVQDRLQGIPMRPNLNRAHQVPRGVSRYEDKVTLLRQLAAILRDDHAELVADTITDLDRMAGRV